MLLVGYRLGGGAVESNLVDRVLRGLSNTQSGFLLIRQGSRYSREAASGVVHIARKPQFSTLQSRRGLFESHSNAIGIVDTQL
jgi:hypothetical protein